MRPDDPEKEPSLPAVQVNVPAGISNSNDSRDMCKICHCGASEENLIVPCRQVYVCCLVAVVEPTLETKAKHNHILLITDFW